MEYAEQERFKTALSGRRLSRQSIDNILSTGRAALRIAWKKGELKSVPPVSMVEVGEQEPMGRPLTVERDVLCLRSCAITCGC